MLRRLPYPASGERRILHFFKSMVAALVKFCFDSVKALDEIPDVFLDVFDRHLELVLHDLDRLILCQYKYRDSVI
jgi:hypothetical protein